MSSVASSPCRAAAFRHRAEAQADDADVHADRFLRQARILLPPVVALDSGLEPAGNHRRFGAAGKVRNQEAELVAAEPRMQIPRAAGALDGQEVLRTNLVGKNPRHPFDDPVAHAHDRDCRCTT